MELAKDSIDVGLVVSDLHAAIDFYCGALGFEKVGEVPLSGNRTLHDIRIGDSMLKLQELHEGAPPRGPRGLIAQSGIRYITIWVHDIVDIVRSLEERGCVFSRPLEMTPRGVRMAMLEDPDGNTVELMERSPSRGRRRNGAAGERNG